MPSIVTSQRFNPYIPNVVQAPVLGSFADMWGVRQESDILLDDGMNSKKYRENTQDDAHPIEEQTTYAEHTTRVVLHNPYSLTQPLTEVYACTCAECNHGTEKSYVDDLVAVSREELEPVDLVDYAALSRFMPPPPPRADTYDVIAACGCQDSDSVVYHMMVRWYTKARASQTLFDVDTECPGPSPDEYTFMEWCAMASDWWLRNFEHRQKKQPAHRAPNQYVLSSHQW